MYTAAQTAAELRRIADALDTNPDLELEPFLSIHATGDNKESFIELAKTMPRPMNKDIDYAGTTYPDFKLQHSFWRIKIPQSSYCAIKVPARPAEYECPTIFSDDEEAELEQA